MDNQYAGNMSIVCLSSALCRSGRLYMLIKNTKLKQVRGVNLSHFRKILRIDFRKMRMANLGNL